jgi:hypothetical protein
MAVSDDQVAAMRAILAHDFDEYDRLSEQLDRVDGWGDYPVLMQAAFFEAVDRRFGKGHTRQDVVRYVADARSRFEQAGQEIDPGAAERLMLVALGDSVSVEDIDGKALGAIEMFVLVALITDENLGVTELDEFMKEVRKSADEWHTNE